MEERKRMIGGRCRGGNEGSGGRTGERVKGDIRTPRTVSRRVEKIKDACT